MSMLKINEEQMDVLDALSMKLYAVNIKKRLVSIFPEVKRNSEYSSFSIENKLYFLREYGINTELLAFKFFVLSIKYAKDLLKYNKTCSILQEDELRGVMKINKIESMLRIESNTIYKRQNSGRK